MATKEEVINSLSMFDDGFMKDCFKKSHESIELVVRIVLGNHDLEFVDFKDQENIPNPNGKQSVLDFVLKDKDGKLYDVEIESQNSRSGGFEKRARYYSALLDSYYLKKGESYIDLPDSYVIFFSRKDMIREGLPLYTVRSTVSETNARLEDGRTLIFVNGENEDDTELGRLVRDFKCTNTEAMWYSELRKAREEVMVSYKYSLERPDNPVLEEYVREFEERGEKRGEERGEIRGRKEAKLETARAMLKDGVSIDKVSAYTSLPIEEIAELNK